MQKYRRLKLLPLFQDPQPEEEPAAAALGSQEKTTAATTAAAAAAPRSPTHRDLKRTLGQRGRREGRAEAAAQK